MTTSRQLGQWIRGTTMYHRVRKGRQTWCGVNITRPDIEITQDPPSYLTCDRCSKLSSSSTS